jgi:rhodanese-related sulfurtransferase
MPLGEIPRRLDDIPTDQLVVAYCQRGTRSMIVANILAAHGRAHVRDLRSGFSAWQASGYAVELGVRDHAARDSEPELLYSREGA